MGLAVLGSIINCCGHPWAGSVVLGQGRVSDHLWTRGIIRCTSMISKP